MSRIWDTNHDDPNPESLQSADHRPNPRSFKPDVEVLSAAVRSLSFCPFGEGYMGCNSIDIFFVPESGPEPGPIFETCLNL